MVPMFGTLASIYLDLFIIILVIYPLELELELLSMLELELLELYCNDDELELNCNELLELLELCCNELLELLELCCNDDELELYPTELEEEARAQRIGLWSDPHPTGPWEWRRIKRGR